MAKQYNPQKATSITHDSFRGVASLSHVSSIPRQYVRRMENGHSRKIAQLGPRFGTTPLQSFLGDVHSGSVIDGRRVLSEGGRVWIGDEVYQRVEGTDEALRFLMLYEGGTLDGWSFLGDVDYYVEPPTSPDAPTPYMLYANDGFYIETNILTLPSAVNVAGWDYIGVYNESFDFSFTDKDLTLRFYDSGGSLFHEEEDADFFPGDFSRYGTVFQYAIGSGDGWRHLKSIEFSFGNFPINDLGVFSVGYIHAVKRG